MISFAGSDFFFNNSGFLFRSLFFLQNRFLLQKFRCQLPATFLSSNQISFPRSDSLLQIGGSLLQYDFFFPVRFLTAKLPLPLPICFLFPCQIPRRKLEDLFCSILNSSYAVTTVWPEAKCLNHWSFSFLISKVGNITHFTGSLRELQRLHIRHFAQCLPTNSRWTLPLFSFICTICSC